MVNWENVPNHDAYKNLLLGNGFSIGISRNFNYWNLLEEAKSRAQMEGMRFTLIHLDFLSAYRPLTLKKY